VHVAARLKTIPKKKQLKVAREVEGMPREKAMKVIEQVKAEPEKSVKEAKKEVEKQEGYSVRVSFNGTEYEALKEAAKSLRVSNVNDASRVIVVDWLANQGFLKSTVEKKPDEEAKTEKTGKETKKGEKKLKYGPTGTVEETDDEIDNWENI
jgi:ribosomal protein L22